MPRIIARTLLLVLIAGGCAACGSSTVGRDELIGDYQIDYGYGVETLRLAADGQYTQLFRQTDEMTWTSNSGAWDFKDGVTVVLHDAMAVDDGTGKLKKDFQKPVPGLAAMTVQKSFGTISLRRNGEPKFELKKLEEPLPSDRKPEIIHFPPRQPPPIVEVK